MVIISYYHMSLFVITINLIFMLSNKTETATKQNKTLLERYRPAQETVAKPVNQGKAKTAIVLLAANLSNAICGK